MLLKKIFILGIVATVLVASSAMALSDLEKKANDMAPKLQKAVVTVKMVIKMRIRQQEQENKVEVVGTVIDPSGLTLVSASSIDPASLINGLMAGQGNTNFKAESDVTSTHLIFDDGSEVEADVILKDPDLDLAFIRPRNSTATYEAVTLTPRTTAPQLLEGIFTMSRLGRSENHVPALNEGSVRAVVKGPRTYYICEDNLATHSLGCVGFDFLGQPLGIFVTKLSQSGTDRGGMAFLTMMQSGRESMTLPMVILRPLEDVLDAVTQAKAIKSSSKSAPNETSKSSTSDVPGN